MIRAPSDGSVRGKLSKYNEFNPEREYPGSYGAMKAKHGENWGIKQPERAAPHKAPTAEQLRQHYAKHNLAFEPKPTPETAIADGESE